MSGLSKRETCVIGGALAICVAVVVVVVMLFLQLGDDAADVQPTEKTTPALHTQTATSDVTATPDVTITPAITPVPTDVIVVPATDGPVFFGVSSSISVDCVDTRFVKNEVVDQLFYLGYSDADYTVTETEDRIVIKLKLETDKDTFTALYAKMLTVIHSCNVEEHLENGASVDQNGIQSDDQYSYLTMTFYTVE